MAVVAHVLHACASRFPSSSATAPDVLLDRVDDQVLDRLVQSPVDLAGDDLGPRDGELVALAAQRLDQDRQVQLAATRDQELVGAVGVLDAQD